MSEKFIFNYHPEKQYFLRQMWSTANCFDTSHYIDWLLSGEASGKLYFDERKTADDQLIV